MGKDAKVSKSERVDFYKSLKAIATACKSSVNQRDAVGDSSESVVIPTTPEECAAVLDVIQALQSVYSQGCPIA